MHVDQWDSSARGTSFDNDSGEEIPAYGCMIVKSARIEAGEIVFTVEKPATDNLEKLGAIVFNGETKVPSGGGGGCQLNYAVNALVDGSPDTDEEIGPTDDSWLLSTSGTGYYKIADGADGDEALVRPVGGGGGGVEIYQYVLTEAWTAGVARADIYRSDGAGAGTLITDNILAPKPLIYDPSRQDIMADQIAGDVGYCYKQGDVYYAIQAPCEGASLDDSTGGGGGPSVSDETLTASTSF